MTKLPDNPEEVRMSFGDHLDELRGRLLRGLLVIAVLFFVGWTFFSNVLQEIFVRPHQRAVEALAQRDPPIEVDMALNVHSPLEPVFFSLKVSLIMALVFGLPFLLYQLWGFVAAGLYPHERKVVSRYVPLGLLSGVLGVLFGYFLAVPLLLEYLYSLRNPFLTDDAYRLQYYFSFFFMFTIALSLIFQLPLVLLGLGSAGLVSPKTLRGYRKHFILGAFVISAVFTPPEPVSQIMMAIPTVLLYELGILLVTWKQSKTGKPSATQSPTAEKSSSQP